VLDCIDLATARPLWRYAYPSYPGAHWGTPWNVLRALSPSSAVEALESARDDWRQLAARPPTVVLNDVSVAGEKAATAEARVVFDPLPFPSRIEDARLIAIAWGLLVAPPLAGFVAWKRLGRARSFSRTLLAMAVCVGTLASLASAGELEVFAMLAGRLVFVVALVFAVRAALGVKPPRLVLLARALLVLAIAGIGVLGLPLLVAS